MSNARASTKGQAFDVIAASRNPLMGNLTSLGAIIVIAATRTPYCETGKASINVRGNPKEMMMLEDAPMTAQDALAALMIAVSASDENIRTAELVKISNSINNLPVFDSYD
ncbi:MAG: hypothetical protein AAFQ00_04735, partial [Pseudomonadota bacterium]